MGLFEILIIKLLSMLCYQVEMKKILIIDRHPIFLKAICEIFRSELPEYLVFESNEFNKGLDIAKKNINLDLIVIDINTPGVSGMCGVLKLHNENPNTLIVAVSSDTNKKTALLSMVYGASGFITKSMCSDEIIFAIKKIISGEMYLPSNIFFKSNENRKNESCSTIKNTEVVKSLTRKQLQVLEQMARGCSNKLIAYNLNIAETTVKAHVSEVLKKLNVSSRIQAIISIYENNLILR